MFGGKEDDDDDDRICTGSGSCECVVVWRSTHPAHSEIVNRGGGGCLVSCGGVNVVFEEGRSL